jgi:hypothetical protein
MKHFCLNQEWNGYYVKRLAGVSSLEFITFASIRNGYVISHLLHIGNCQLRSPITRYSSDHRARWHYHAGCGASLRRWLNRSADALFVIGLCVIAFLKLTFLGLMRFEMREMMDKIRILRREKEQMMLNGDLPVMPMELDDGGGGVLGNGRNGRRNTADSDVGQLVNFAEANSVKWAG